MSQSPFSEKYLKFVQWLKKEEIISEPFTNTQHKFIEFLLENEDVIPLIGDLNGPFKLFRKWQKRDINDKEAK